MINKELMQLANQQNNAQAQYELGLRLCCGEGGEFNNPKGFEYTCKAAKQGYTPAQKRMGEVYKHGIAFELSPTTLAPFLIPQDRAASYAWYSLAAEAGDASAEDIRDDLHDDMDINELNAAIAKRKLWRRTDCTKG